MEGRNILKWKARSRVGKIRLATLAVAMAVLFVVLVSFDPAARPVLPLPQAYDPWLEYAFFAGAGMWVLGMVLHRSRWCSPVAETGILVVV